MGTHPIFESDFDCLTEWVLVRQNQKSRFLLILENYHLSGVFSNSKWAVTTLSVSTFIYTTKLFQKQPKILKPYVLASYHLVTRILWLMKAITNFLTKS